MPTTKLTKVERSRVVFSYIQNNCKPRKSIPLKSTRTVMKLLSSSRSRITFQKKRRRKKRFLLEWIKSVVEVDFFIVFFKVDADVSALFPPEDWEELHDHLLLFICTRYHYHIQVRFIVAVYGVSCLMGCPASSTPMFCITRASQQDSARRSWKSVKCCHENVAVSTNRSTQRCTNICRCFDISRRRNSRHTSPPNNAQQLLLQLNLTGW